MARPITIAIQTGTLKRRTGFTIIELLVAMSLTLFIMVIISTAFVTGLDTFRGLKGIGDMQQRLRTATMRLRRDLQADHFEGKRRLSDPAFTSQGKVRRGFFRIVQPSAPQDVWQDEDGLSTARTTDHVLHFSIKARGDRPQDFLSATVPFGAPYGAAAPKPFDAGSAAKPNPFYKETNFFNQPFDAVQQQFGTYTSQWAEVAYFTEKSGSTANPDDPNNTQGTPLFALYRLQRVVVPRNDQLKRVVRINRRNQYAEMSCGFERDPKTNAPTGFLKFYSPEDLANGERSFSYPPLPADRRLGASLLATHVVSFRVQITRTGNLTGGEIFHDVGGVLDTATSTSRILAIRITLRIWDPATQQTRQITVVQDL